MRGMFFGVAAAFLALGAAHSNKTTYAHNVLFPGAGQDLCMWFAFDNITAIDGSGVVYDMTHNATVVSDIKGACSITMPTGPSTQKWIEFLSFSMTNANEDKQLMIQLFFSFNATFDTNDNYQFGNNASAISKLQVTFAAVDKEGNVTVLSTANFTKPGNQSMYAAYESSYRCTGAFNYTADGPAADAAVEVADATSAKKNTPAILSIVNVALQSFIPLGTKTPSPAYTAAVCPHIVNKRNTIGLIVGGGIAGVAFLAIFVFAFTNCKKSQNGYQSLDAV